MSTFYSELAFLEAWKRGVEIAGWQFFGTGQPVAATSKYDLAPSYDMIERAMSYLSSGEAVFLAAMYSFYNSDAGGKWLTQLGVNGLGAVSASLDEKRCKVIADLLFSYAGW